ncbi:NAD(P)H-dependent oxidoreductase [Nocardioides sp. GY 10127]|uniref:NADPH-dependent FMN reductase n=1 Tax=Nocardioides sp. GY 10127 TaxID=2569762 RepID=UPI0010A8DFD8|nr:NAD(P)H-dependent oxidoreductase [Nocardioides sp. GY 10127]TIC79256.1 NAD(P)H-dependent oxidoreductase [Nocardioides sp. GY 10127]
MKIGVVIGSVRKGRRGASVAEWVAEAAKQRDGVEVSVVDLAEYNVPILDEETLPMMAGKSYADAGVQAWSAAIDECDAYVFVTPEYNHGVPGAFKNAVDSLGPEWVGKTVAFVSYGADGGVRATEQWRQIMVNFQMYDVRGFVALGLFSDFGESGFAPMERRTAELGGMLDQLVALATKLAG